MKIISMTEFVINEDENFKISFDESFVKCVNYANFLKQPTKLGMFIPCDENDVPLDEPSDYKFWIQDSEFGAYNGCQENKCMEYEQAKERVLFDGFKAEKYGESDEIINAELIKNNSLVFRFPNSFVSKIEDLVKYNITLTDSAIKKYKL